MLAPAPVQLDPYMKVRAGAGVHDLHSNMAILCHCIQYMAVLCGWKDCFDTSAPVAFVFDSCEVLTTHAVLHDCFRV